MAAGGDIQRNQTRLEGKQNRLTVGAQGEQERRTQAQAGRQASKSLGKVNKIAEPNVKL